MALKSTAYGLINKIILALFSFFVFLTLYFALVSPNLTLGDNVARQVIGEKTTWLSITFILLVVGTIIGIVIDKRIRYCFNFIFYIKGKITAPILFMLVVGLQLLFVFATHPAIGFDPGAIHSALTNTTDDELVSYFSLSTNNLPLLLIQHHIAVYFSNHSWLLFDIVTLILVDISVILNTITISIIDRTKVIWALYLQSIFLLVFPMIIVPYSDTWVLPLVSSYLLCYVIAQRRQRMSSILIMGLGGILVALTYFIKPSAIVPVVAIILIELLGMLRALHLKQFKILIYSISAVALMLLTMFVTVTYGQQQINKQDYIQIRKGDNMPPIHFISMGLSGDGGYNPKDNIEMAKRPAYEDKVTYSENILKQRLAKLGIFGYLKFLLHKHNKNTSDGTFAWLIEGHFIQSKLDKQDKSRFFKNLVYPKGKYVADFRYIAQWIWICILGLMAFGFNYHHKLAQVLRLSIIGAFVYLLIFEGGRSRYLIQFLPVIFILATLSSSYTVNLFKRTFAWMRI